MKPAYREDESTVTCPNSLLRKSAVTAGPQTFYDQHMQCNQISVCGILPTCNKRIYTCIISWRQRNMLLHYSQWEICNVIDRHFPNLYCWPWIMAIIEEISLHILSFLQVSMYVLVRSSHCCSLLATMPYRSISLLEN